MVEKSWDVEEYFSDLNKSVMKEYEVANLARGKGIDPEKEVEIPLASSMAEKCVGLISTLYSQLPISDITRRMFELEEMYGKMDSTVSFVIAREIAEEKFCKFENQIEAIDCGIRVAFAYITLGVVSCPIEGYTGLKLGKTQDGKDYFIASFSGPIRAAGTTAICVCLMLIDFLREHFGYAKYDATEEEVKRYVVDNTDYHERVSNLQYFPTEEEMVFLAERLPIQIDGEPTDKREVSNYKDLSRVSTNRIRGGMCLAFSEGLAQKAEKALGRLSSVKKNGLICTGFDWLKDYVILHKKREGGSEDVEATYIKDLVAGRPVYGHPSRSGAFRLRYGRSRVSGFSAVSIHPATMGVSNDFLSHGTQLKLEKPIKGCIITGCDQIDGPIVKLKNGSVRKMMSFEEAKKNYNEIDEIIYIGDMLFPVGDIIDRNSDLVKSGYVEEWWSLELENKLGITGEKLDYDKFNVGLDEAMRICDKYSLPLYPKYIYYWSEIILESFWWFLDWLQNGVWRGVSNGKLVLPWENSVRDKFAEAKRALELLGVSHEVVFDNVVIDNVDAKALLVNLGIPFLVDGGKLRGVVSEMINNKNDFDHDVLNIVNGVSKFVIKDKAGDFVGARMGRPEKAKLRKLTGSPNCLFPVGDQGGRLRSINDAVEVGYVKSNFPKYKCGCGNETVYGLCEKCGKNTRRVYFCGECGHEKLSVCKIHNNSDLAFMKKVDVKHLFNDAVSRVGYESYEVPPLVKGVRALNNNNGFFEHPSKGILRSKFNLSVNKDGTIRYDGTEVPLTHFKPLEIGVGVDKLKEIGYVKDIYGDELIRDNQILELRPHDIVLPSCPVTSDEKGDDVFFNIANFLDEELIRLYGLEGYYKVRSREDLIGKMVVCMAPHNCAGVVGRIIGFSKIQGIMASPYMHAAMRRDCDGDECTVMMLMDVLLNFSRKFLSGHRGATQDAPLVLNVRIQAGEVDDQILNFELVDNYPLELYELAEKRTHSSEVKIERVIDRLKNDVCAFTNVGFTHDSTNYNDGVLNGAYKSLPSMKEKVSAQMELVEKIRAVDTDDVARLIIEKHFIRDIRGNLRKFSRQQFRCSSCNEKYRRPPLIGECRKCGGKLIFTVSEGSIKKYLDPAIELANNYNISDYTKEGMELVKEYIESIFGVVNEEQMQLSFSGVRENAESGDAVEEELEGTDDVSEDVSVEDVDVQTVVETEKKDDVKEAPKGVVETKKDDIIEENKSNSDFVHLHLHTEYSFLDGAIKVTDLFKRVKELGMDAVAITEHGNMESMIKKYQMSKKEGVKLIFGFEPYIVNDMGVKDKKEKRAHLILLAKNYEGFLNLMKLVSVANAEGFYYRPRLDKETLKKYSEGLICMSACIANDIARAVIADDIDLARELIKSYVDIYGKENFYLEIQDHGIIEEKKVRDVYFELAKEFDVGVVATNDAHYLLKEDKKAHEAMLCIQTNGSLDDPNHFKFDGEGFYVMSGEEMKELFVEHPEVLKNSVDIANRCNVELKLGETIFPDFEVPEGFDHESYMVKLCGDKLEETYAGKENYEEAKERLGFELSVINKMGFSTYFLIVWDFIKDAKMKCQIGPGRGCVFPETKVLMSDGYEKRIDDVKIGDKIITHKGNVLPVFDVMNYNCDEEVVRLKLRNEDLCLTRDHKLWCVRSEKCSVRGDKLGVCKIGCKRGCNDRLFERYELEWIAAGELKKDDFVVFPRVKSSNENITFDLLDYVSDRGYLKYDDDNIWYEIGSNRLETKKIPRYIKFDEDLAKFLGYYIAEGWSRVEERRCSVGFGFHKDEVGYANDVVLLFEKIFGIEGKVVLHKTRNSQQVIANSKIVGEFLEGVCGKGALNKKIDDNIVMRGEDRLVRILIAYMFRGDGHDGRSGKTINIKYSTTSKDLASQLRMLLIRFGYFSNIHVRRHFGRNEEWNDEYSVKLSGKQLLNWNENFGGFEIPIGKQKFYRNDSFFVDVDYIYYKIKKVSFEKYKGKVWDISVNGDTSYVGNSAAIHNSGAGSIVAYLLGITQLEPLSLGLLFERFLNPDRISLPDFDIDFGDRDVVIDYVKEKYGEDKIALIGTYGTMSAKSVLKDVMRVFKIPFNVANDITDYVNEKTIQKSLDLKDDNGEFVNVKLIDFKFQYPEIFEIAQKLEGSVRHKGIHACGVVWGKTAINEYFPTSVKDGFTVAQAEGWEIEESGLVKFDFLGLETLNITKKVLDFIGEKSEWLENVSLMDEGIYEMLREGESVGVFQLESGGMQKTLKLVKPTCFDDIIAIVALYRPGPMQYLEVYADRKSGKEKVTYPHPWAEEILGPTYGIMVYQEQVMQLSQKLAGFSGGEADTLRKAIGKKKLDLMKQMEDKFKDGCMSVAKMEKDVVEKLWDDIVKFASYSFNKSHAACYALISYRTAFLRKYYPVEFMAATLSSNTSNPEKMTFYLDEAKNMGIEILGPDVNLSKIDFNVEEKEGKKVVRFGLRGIKNVGDGAMASILEKRSYLSYQDFASKVDLTKVNKRVLKNLISVGCFDSFGEGRGELLATYEDLKKNGSSGKQLTLFGSEEGGKVVSSDLSLREKIELEREIMGVCISCHPVDLFVEGGSPNFVSYDKLVSDEDVSLFGIVKKFRAIKTKSGDDMAFITISDKNNDCDLVVFPRVFDELRTVMNFKEGDGVVVNGKYNEDLERGNSVFVNEIHRATEKKI